MELAWTFDAAQRIAGKRAKFFCESAAGIAPVKGLHDGDNFLTHLFIRCANHGDVRYLGTEKAGGKTVHRIQIDSAPFHPSLIPATNLSHETVTSGVLELLIDDSGRPISGSASVKGTGRVSGQLQEIVIELNFTFTKLGQKVTVSAP